MNQKAIDFFEQGKKFQQQGILNSAKQSYLQALKINPEYGQAYNNLGNVFSDQGDLKQAEQAYLKALELIPDHPMILNNLANCFHLTGQNDQAKLYLAKALEIAPHDPYAHSSLGNVLKDLGDKQGAINAYKKSISLDSNIGQVYVNLGNVLKQIKDIDGAISSYESAIKNNPKLAEAYANLGGLYETHNKLDNLEKVYKQAKQQLDANNPILLYLKAKIAYRDNDFAETINSLEGVSPEKFPLGFQKAYSTLLAKAHDKVGNYEKAFLNFNFSNELAKKSHKAQKFDPNNYLSVISELSLKWSTSQNIQWQKADNKYDSKRQLVFLVGFPRSGTTLLDTILRSHAEVEVVEEESMVFKMYSRLNGQVDPRSLSELKGSDIEQLREIYFEELFLHLKETDVSRIIIDKLPLNIAYIGLIKRVFPESKIILALRHPYDVVFSCFMQSFELNDAMSNFLSINTSAKLYNEIMTLWENYERALELDYVMIKYEDLISDLKAAVTPVLSHLGLDWDDNLLNYQQTAFDRSMINTPSYNQVTQNLYKNSINRWINYKEQMKDADKNLIPWVKKFNY